MNEEIMRKNNKNIKKKKERQKLIEKFLRNCSGEDFENLEEAKELLEEQIARLEQENRELSKEEYREDSLGQEER